MPKVSMLLLLIAATLPTTAIANNYTLILKNGSNPQCDISTVNGGRVVVQNRIVALSESAEDNGTYTYQWSNSYPQTVAIQVDLQDLYVPDVWMDPGCIYAPEFTPNHTTFTQQYLEPDPNIPYSCTCSSQWNE